MISCDCVENNARKFWLLYSTLCDYIYFNDVFKYLFSYVLGKILDDGKKISEYKIEEKNFVVIMVAKVSCLS